VGKKTKTKKPKPDELFSRGPLTVARFGKHLILESHWPEGEFEEMQRKLVERYPIVANEIDTLVSEIADIISALPPAMLLHRAWWEMAHRHMNVEAEAEITEDDGVLMRMIDYTQSVIASAPPATEQSTEVTEEAWTTLKEKVSKLFRKVNLEYQACCSAKNKSQEPNFDENFEEFRVRAQLYWCNIRGHRYQVHDPVYLRDMFLPHSSALQELFGISGDQFVGEITKIWRVLTFGLQEAVRSLVQLQKDVAGALEEKVASVSQSSEPGTSALMDEVVRERGWQSRVSQVRGLWEMDLFDVEKVTSLPRTLLNELSWAPGEEKTFFADGEFRGWPLRIWPIFQRPLIRLDGRYCCFDLYSLLDHIYRTIQRTIFRLKPSHREIWNTIQKSYRRTCPSNISSGYYREPRSCARSTIGGAPTEET
jgi:hypothetical protein